MSMRRSLTFAVVVSAVICGRLLPVAGADDTAAELSTAAIQQKADAARLAKQAAEKQQALSTATLDVAKSRVTELQKQLADAAKRVSAAETAVADARKQIAAADQRLAEVTHELQQHQAADALQKIADQKQAAVDLIVASRETLALQVVALRKSSIEWRSKASEAEQQVAALVAQKPELEKKIAEAKAAADVAVKTQTDAAQAAEAAAKAVDVIKAQIVSDQQKADAARQSAAMLVESLQSLQKSADALRESAKVTGADVTGTTRSLETAIGEFAPLKKNTDELIAALIASVEAQTKAMPAAVAIVEKTTADLKTATDAANVANAALQTQMAALTAVNEQEGSAKKAQEAALAEQTAVDGQISEKEPVLQKLAADIHAATADLVGAQRSAQAAMEPLGRFVSFSREVAPILADRCIACHNTRSPGGRLNLDSFAALMKGGESGATVEPHRSADSLLLTMVEDGSMPKDADPLTAEQIDALRRWINAGSPLDAGLLAGAELFDVMPESPQPLPPATYHVPIPVTATAFSPDGSLLASSGYHEVLIWKTDDGAMVHRITNVAERVYDLEFSHDGTQLVVAAGTPGQLGEAKVFAVADGSLQRTLLRSRDAVFAVSISPDHSMVATAGADRTIVVVNATTGDVVTKIEDHADWVMDVNWSPDGKRLVSSSRDKTCKVFDSATGQPQTTFNGHGESVYSAAFLADSKSVASGGSDRQLRIWNADDGKEIRKAGGFGGDIFRVVVTEGDHVLTASADRNAREHTAADGKEIRQFAGHKDWVYTLCANAGRKLVATGSYDGEVRVWNAEDGSMTTSFIAVPTNQPGAAVATVQP